MSRQWKPGRTAIEPRPSRIRRDPPARAEKELKVHPPEREAWIVAIGVLLFAIALAIITIGISDITSK